MKIGCIVCVIFCLLFLLFALLFMFLKGKAAILISGYNSLSKEERAQYDTERMSKDQAHAFLTWSVIYAIGALLSYIISAYFAIPAFILWLILFIKDVHLDDETAFGSYKIKP